VTTLDVLQAARNLISDPAHWTQGYWARTADGDLVQPEHPMAVCWCVAGAVNKVGLLDKKAIWMAIIALETILDVTPWKRLLFDYNDEHTHAEVLALLDRAIARLQTESTT
jgi:hypothetical protein